MTTIEKIEIDGIIKEIEVDWSMYGGATEGRNATRSKKAYMKFLTILEEVNGELITSYINDDSNVTIKIDDVFLTKSVNKFKYRNFELIKNFKQKVNKYGDDFIKFTRLDEQNSIIALIKTSHEEMEIAIGRYETFVKTRERYYELFRSYGFEIKSAYKGNKSNMTFEIDGCTFQRSPVRMESCTLVALDNFKNSLEKCDTFVKYVAFENKKIKVELDTIDEYGNKGTIIIALNDYKNFCNARKRTYDYLKENNYITKSIYFGFKEKMIIDFKCGHEPHAIEVGNLLQGKGCPECKRVKATGINSPTWKGGITPLHNYLRERITPWKKDSMKKYNRTCVITGKKSSKNIVHHLIGFNTILFETMDVVGLDIRENISLYTAEELQLIEDKCLELHYKYGLGVVLSPEVHEEFHINYKFGNNTPEQFEEFKNMKLKELEKITQ